MGERIEAKGGGERLGKGEEARGRGSSSVIYFVHLGPDAFVH